MADTETEKVFIDGILYSASGRGYLNCLRYYSGLSGKEAKEKCSKIIEAVYGVQTDISPSIDSSTTETSTGLTTTGSSTTGTSTGLTTTGSFTDWLSQNKTIVMIAVGLIIYFMFIGRKK